MFGESVVKCLTTIEVRTPVWWRALEVLAGILVIVLAGIVLADSQFAITTLVYVIGAALLIGGLSRIGVGVFGSIFSPVMRGLNAGGGIIAVVVAVVVILDPQLGIAALIVILAAALLLVGVVEVVVGGFFARHRPLWFRGVLALVGALTIILSALVVLDSALGQVTLAIILSIVLVIIGIRDIAHGVTGHRPVQVPARATVTSV